MEPKRTTAPLTSHEGALARGVKHRVNARRHALGMSFLEGGIALSVLSLLLAVAIPVFARELHASRFTEAASGVKSLGAAAVAYAEDKRVAEAFPVSAAMTPATAPRGNLETVTAEAWDTPTWKALAFQPAVTGAPHAFAFAFDSTLGTSRSTFVAHAHGDLDGDGVTSTFEVRGVVSSTEKVRVEPGMYVEAEVE